MDYIQNKEEFAKLFETVSIEKTQFIPQRTWERAKMASLLDHVELIRKGNHSNRSCSNVGGSCWGVHSVARKQKWAFKGFGNRIPVV